MEYRRAAHVAWRKIGNDTVVVDLKAKTIFGLNNDGGAVWHALAEPKNTSQLARILHPAESKQTRIEAIERAVKEFLSELHALGLVEGATAPSPQEEDQVDGRFSLEGVPLPKIIWRDAIRNFGVSCSRQSGNPGCQGVLTI